jgi:hypothetical protein
LSVTHADRCFKNAAVAQEFLFYTFLFSNPNNSIIHWKILKKVERFFLFCFFIFGKKFCFYVHVVSSAIEIIILFLFFFVYNCVDIACRGRALFYGKITNPELLYSPPSRAHLLKISDRKGGGGGGWMETDYKGT